MPLIKLQTDVAYELIQKLEAHKARTKKSKAAIVSEALREYFERQENPEPDPTPHLAAVPLDLPAAAPMKAAFRDLSGQYHPATYNVETSTLQVGPASPADLFPEDPEDEVESTPGLKNVEPEVLTPDEALRRLKERLAASKSGQEIDELTREITRIEGARTVALLNALPGPDPTYVAAREPKDTTL